MRKDVCRSCGAEDLQFFYEANKIPTHSCRLYDSLQESTQLSRGDLFLGLCLACGFIQNSAFDSGLVDYAESYEDTQAFSPHFRSYATNFADRVLDRYMLYGKTVLEIGCGQGDFLNLICERGSMRGIGFDPAYRPKKETASPGGAVEIRRELYTRDNCLGDADLILCRHTLEHIPSVRSFMETVRECIEEKRDTILCFEVPDAERILKENAFWDVYYEHCSYFTTASLQRLFEASGFVVLDVRKTYGEQYIVLEAKAAHRPAGEQGAPPSDVSVLAQDAHSFRINVSKQLGRWRTILDEFRESRQRVVLWGAGSKAAGFLSRLGVTDEVSGVVDINPQKHGHYQAGTAQRIVGPEALKTLQPGLVIIMNPVYRLEIEEQLGTMGLTPRVLTL